MAKKTTSKDLADIRQRLAKGNLTAKDIATLDEILGKHIESFKAIEASGTKVGAKTLIARLPFGFDIVK
jgi:hypothetical protein